jgi:septin family protein
LLSFLHQPYRTFPQAGQYLALSPIHDDPAIICLTRLVPTGDQIDVTVLRKLSEVTNVVPIIAKSDSLTLQERELFKERVSKNLLSVRH